MSIGITYLSLNLTLLEINLSGEVIIPIVYPISKTDKQIKKHMVCGCVCVHDGISVIKKKEITPCVCVCVYTTEYQSLKRMK